MTGDEFPLPTQNERFIMAYVSMTVGIIGMAINLYMFFAFLHWYRSEYGFYKLCISKTISNWLMCASYVFYLVPTMFNNGNFLPTFIRLVPEQIVGYVAYLMGPLVQLYLAINRTLAIYTPFVYKNNHFHTIILILFSWVSTIVFSIVVVKYDCEFGLNEKHFSWGLTNQACNPSFASMFFYVIIFISVTSNTMNIACGVKFFKESRNRAIGTTISTNQRIRAKKLIMQCIIQDCLHVIDMINILYTYTLFPDFIWNFLCCSISMLAIHVIDGFVMLIFNRTKLSTTPRPGASFSSKNPP